MKKLTPVQVYVAVVCGVGLGLLATMIGEGDLGAILSARSLLFAGFVLIGELLPISVPRSREEDQITTSTTFALALLLTAGLLPAVAAQAAGSVIADLARRKPLWKTAFNAAQYCIALSAGAAMLIALTGHVEFGDGQLTAAGLPAALAAGAAFLVANTSLTGVALALAQRVRVASYLRSDLAFQLSTDGVLLVLAPIVVLASERSLLMIPLIAVPMVAVYRSARVSLENTGLVRRLEDSLSELEEMNRLNEHQALHDSLTGLPNRTLFLDRLGHAIKEASRDGTGLALLMIDLDRFKDVNDTLGHHEGDLLLQQIALRLQETVRESDTVARLGGDEFGVLLPRIGPTEHALLVAERLRDALEQPFPVDGITLDVEASTGISLFPRDGTDAETLIQRADLAMYGAKSGNVAYQVYSAKDDHLARSRISLLGELRRAIDHGELVLYYQPKVDLQSQDVVGVEALLRWHHPTRKVIPPDEFIPFAEHTGLIRPLTLYVIDAALKQSQEWRRSGLDLSVAVNLSARNVVDPELPHDVSVILERWGVAPHQLELELTESALSGEPVRAMEVLTALSRMDVGLSLDDFGTGYSSLASISRLPVDEIKIDRSFVTNMATVESDAVIVRSTIDLGHNLGMRVVAEGVETEEVWSRLAALECDVAQGFYLSRPIPPDELAGWVAQWRRSLGAPPKPDRLLLLPQSVTG
jgi:diguanylate cyclase (GGDEF)-like protein